MLERDIIDPVTGIFFVFSLFPHTGKIIGGVLFCFVLFIFLYGLPGLVMENDL